MVLAPVMAIIALLLRIETAGPVLYAPAMIGRGGHPFTLYRFRTMRDTRAAGTRELTRVGAVIRDVSLDHLPMLANLLLGDVTLIGPRPMEPEYVDMSDPAWQAYFRIGPGIFNYAVLRMGRDFGPSRAETMPQKQALEAEYAARQSAGFDLRLLVRYLKTYSASRGNVKARGRPEAGDDPAA